MLGVLAKLTANLFQFDLGSKSPVSYAKNDHLELTESGFLFSKIETFQIVVSEWGTPAGIDLESRLAESGLCNCFLTDTRNFGHGRFLWIEKWKESTLIVLINTPDSKNFINRFKKALPNGHLACHFDSPFLGILGAIYCTVRSILFFGELAKQKLVDPGKPEVPQWGKNIHKLYFTSEKSNVETKKRSQKKYPAMHTSFSAVVFDFDGTLVDTRRRYEPIPEEIIFQLNRLLSEGLVLGIATGRGSSAYKELEERIDKDYHGNVLVGLYNGSIIKKLSLDEEIYKPFWPIRDLIKSVIKNRVPHNLDVSVKPTNISVRGGSAENRIMFSDKIIHEIGQHARFIKRQVSGHSVDIFPNCASKLLVVQGLIESSSTKVLCIGDQGQVDGNDEELLSWVPSISVGKERPSSELCFWIGKDPQLRESSGTLKILESIQKHDSDFRLNLDYRQIK